MDALNELSPAIARSARPRLGTLLRADLHRLGPGRSLLAALLLRRCFRALATLRLCQALAASPAGRLLLPLALLAHRAARHWAGMDLPWRTQIGPGCRIDHGWGLVLNAGARLGANVTLFHGVTLGQRDRIAPDGSRSSGVPQIDDEVWIGPHAVIVGDVRIGRGSRIAAGAFVTSDVPPHSLVVGNPAQIVQQEVLPDVAHPWAAP